MTKSNKWLAFIVGIILFLFVATMIFGCKKEDKQEYSITLIVTGQGNYNYKIGGDNHAGHCTTKETFAGIAKIGDNVSLSATPDSALAGISVELDSDPVVGASNQHKAGSGTQTVQFQF